MNPVLLLLLSFLFLSSDAQERGDRRRRLQSGGQGQMKGMGPSGQMNGETTVVADDSSLSGSGSSVPPPTPVPTANDGSVSGSGSTPVYSRPTSWVWSPIAPPTVAPVPGSTPGPTPHPTAYTRPTPTTVAAPVPAPTPAPIDGSVSGSGSTPVYSRPTSWVWSPIPPPTSAPVPGSNTPGPTPHPTATPTITSATPAPIPVPAPTPVPTPFPVTSPVEIPVQGSGSGGSYPVEIPMLIFDKTLDINNLAFVNSLADSETTPFGTVYGSCAYLQTQIYSCIMDFHMNRGTVMATGTIFGYTSYSTLVVIGGTGQYQGVSGIMTLLTDNQDYQARFNIVS